MRKATFITLLLFVSYFMKAQLVNENFEGTNYPPTGWLAFENCSDSDDDEDIEWVRQDDQSSVYNNTFGWAHTGLYAAMSSFGYVDGDEGWLVTPQVTPTRDNSTLHFFHKQAYHEEYHDTFSVRVSTTSQDTPGDFTTLLSINEANTPYNFEEETVDLSAYVGTPIYIAFVHHSIDGDEWYIDDVYMTPPTKPGATTDPIPADGATDITIINTQTSRVDLSWTDPTTGGAGIQTNFFFGDSPTHLSLLGHPTTNAAHPRTLHYNFTYYWKAAVVNEGGDNASIWSFTTSDYPTVTAPYTIDFENSGNVPNGMDQLISNEKFWHFADTPPTGHVGNAGDMGTAFTESAHYFAFIIDGNNPEHPAPQGSSLLTPFINMSGLTTPGMSIYINSDNEGSVSVNFKIEAWDGATWQTVYTSSQNTNGWVNRVVDLSTFTFASTNHMQFKFVVDEPVTSDDHDDFAIDDFRIDELSTMTNNQLSISNLSIYPNPVKDMLQIEAEFTPSKVEIYNINGKLINTYYKTKTIPFTQIPKGEYLINIYQGNNSIALKVIK